LEEVIVMAKVLCRIAAAAAVALALALPGCSWVDDTLERFDRAIEEVRKLRWAAQTESAEWRRFIEERQTQATKDVRDIIREEFREAFLDAAIEAHCLIDVIEGKVLTYLKAIEDALLAMRAKIERDGSSKGVTPEAIVARIIEERRQEAPHVCHCTPRSGVVPFAMQTASGTAPQFVPERPELELVGHGLRRPKDDKAELGLFVGPDVTAMREVPDSATLLFAVSSYKLLVDLEKLAGYLRPTDRRLELRWGDEPLTQLKLPMTSRKPPVKKRVYVELHHLDIFQTGLNKDHWWMLFTVRGGSEQSARTWEHDRVILDPRSKDEEAGPDNLKKTYTRFPLEGRTLGPFNLREGDTLHVSCFGVAKVSAQTQESVTRYYGKKPPPGWLKQTDIVPGSSKSFEAYESWGLTQEPLTAEGAKFRIGEYDRQLGGPAYWAYFTIREAK
jgi:hypothetical protein